MSKSSDFCTFPEKDSVFFFLTINGSLKMLSPSTPYPAY